MTGSTASSPDPSGAQDPMQLALAIASDPNAQTHAAGPASMPSRSLWSLMSWKLKAIALASAAAGAAFLAPPGALASLASHSPLASAPASVAAPSAAPAFVGVVGALQSHSIAARAPAPQPLAGAPVAAPKPAAATPAAARPVAGPLSLARPASSAPLEDHPRADQVPAQAPATLSLTSRIDAALPGGGKGLTHSEMALRMLPIDPFMALATAIENVEQRVYYDPGGTNLGMGYCVTKRVAEYGKERVQSDLIHAGLSAGQAKTLIGNDRKAHKSISLTPAGALRLLEITKPDYQGLAEDAYGKEAFAKLPAHRQAALTYIAYNTGNVGQFISLIGAAHKGDHVKAMQNLAMHWKDQNGARHTNDRSRAWLQAAWLGTDHLADALKNPSAFESDVGQPSNEAVMANLAKPGAARDKLLARRTQASAWAFKALTRERAKSGPGSTPLKGL